MALKKVKFYKIYRYMYTTDICMYDRYMYTSNNLTLPNVYIDILVSLPAVILITALDLEIIRIKSRMSL